VTGSGPGDDRPMTNDPRVPAGAVKASRSLRNESGGSTDGLLLDRYSRQILFEPIGKEGQRRLLASRVTLIGCGALGTALANAMVRAGVGFLRIVDRDYIELNNLARQCLFDEQDIAENLPKAEAARRKLARINSQASIEAVIADANRHTIETFAAGADLLLDGTDNFETRFLINDTAVKHGIPWIYGACVAATGLAMPILPRVTPCLRCVFEQAPLPEMTPTCDTVGVLGPVVTMVASHQAMEAIKILTGHLDAVNRRLVHFDAWSGRIAQLNMQKAYDDGNCPCCREGKYEYLDGSLGSSAVHLCGHDAVQIVPSGGEPGGAAIDFAALAAKLRPVAAGAPVFNAFLLRVGIDRYQITVFTDGRAIIKGTNKPEEARSIYARYIGA